MPSSISKWIQKRKSGQFNPGRRKWKKSLRRVRGQMTSGEVRRLSDKDIIRISRGESRPKARPDIENLVNSMHLRNRRERFIYNIVGEIVGHHWQPHMPFKKIGTGELLTRGFGAQKIRPSGILTTNFIINLLSKEGYSNLELKQLGFRFAEIVSAKDLIGKGKPELKVLLKMFEPKEIKQSMKFLRKSVTSYGVERTRVLLKRLDNRATKADIFGGELYQKLEEDYGNF